MSRRQLKIAELQRGTEVTAHRRRVTMRTPLVQLAAVLLLARARPAASGESGGPLRRSLGAPSPQQPPQTRLVANEAQQHYHQGKLRPYELGPPSILLTQADEEKLGRGETLMQALVKDERDPTDRRLLMVRDIAAPADIILSRVNDLEAYPRMIKGCDECSVYSRVVHEESGLEVSKAKYKIHALHIKLSYFMTHTFDPALRCMTFRLDYDRRSDLDDSVGYWYVQPRDAPGARGDPVCRVYYSCDSKMRGWVPAPVYSLLTKKALTQTTTWLNDEALLEWEKEKLRLKNTRQEGLAGFAAGFKGKLDSFDPGGMRRRLERMKPARQRGREGGAAGSIPRGPFGALTPPWARAQRGGRGRGKQAAGAEVAKAEGGEAEGGEAEGGKREAGEQGEEAEEEAGDEAAGGAKAGAGGWAGGRREPPHLVRRLWPASPRERHAVRYAARRASSSAAGGGEAKAPEGRGAIRVVRRPRPLAGLLERIRV